MIGGNKYKKNISAVNSGRTMSPNIELVVLLRSGSVLSPCSDLVPYNSPPNRTPSNISRQDSGILLDSQ